jgi:hypothetical protein
MGVITKKHKTHMNRTRKMRGGRLPPDNEVYGIMCKLFIDRNGNKYKVSDLSDLMKKRMMTVFKRLYACMKDYATYRSIMGKKDAEVSDDDKAYIAEHTLLHDKSTGNCNKVFSTKVQGIHAELMDKYSLRPNLVKYRIATKLPTTKLTGMDRYKPKHALSSGSDLSDTYTAIRGPVSRTVATATKGTRAVRTTRRAAPKPESPVVIDGSPDWLADADDDAAAVITKKPVSPAVPTRAQRATRPTRVSAAPTGMSGVGSMPDIEEQVNAAINKRIGRITSTVVDTVRETINGYITRAESSSPPLVPPKGTFAVPRTVLPAYQSNYEEDLLDLFGHQSPPKPPPSPPKPPPSPPKPPRSPPKLSPSPPKSSTSDGESANSIPPPSPSSE